jgi:hypothetical protein
MVIIWHQKDKDEKDKKKHLSVIFLIIENILIS